MIDFIPAPEVGEGVIKCVNTVLGIEVLYDKNPARWGVLNNFGCWWKLLDPKGQRAVVPSIVVDATDGVSWRSGEPDYVQQEQDFFLDLFTVHAAFTAQQQVEALKTYIGQVEKDLEWARKVQSWIAGVLQGVEPVKPVRVDAAGVETVIRPALESDVVPYLPYFRAATTQVWQGFVPAKLVWCFTSRFGVVKYSQPDSWWVDVSGEHFTYSMSSAVPKHDRALVDGADELARVQAWLKAVEQHVTDTIRMKP